VAFTKMAIVLSGANCVTAANALPGTSLPPSAQAHALPLTLVNAIVFSVDDIAAEPGETVPIRATLPTAEQLASVETSEGAFILIRNIPAGITISSGMFTGKVWIVSLQDAADLQLTSAPDMTGDFTLDFFLIGSGNKLLAKDAAALVLQSRQSTGAVNTASEPPEETNLQTRTELAETPQSLTLPALPQEEEDVLLQRGEELLQEGGIAAARLIFEELASRGSGKGAFALAQTYDPAFIPLSQTSAVKPDVDEAMKWYQRAAIYGNAEAKQRLAALASDR
jgi:hypothetical protein